MAFVNRIGEVAEQQLRHRDIRFGWGSVKGTNYTHKIKGLTESDFTLVAKLDRLNVPAKG